MPSNKNFGITFSIVFFILFIFFYDVSKLYFSILLSLSVIFLILGLNNSELLSKPNKYWNRFGILLGTIIAPIVMSVVFYLVVVPIGIFMKIIKSNYLDIKIDKNIHTYWKKKDNYKFNFDDQF
tara:strand:+ start:1327 stop:1698 length:372 start_codon:yes stop_codon:yes gene_type:complete